MRQVTSTVDDGMRIMCNAGAGQQGKQNRQKGKGGANRVRAASLSTLKKKTSERRVASALVL